MAIHKRQVTYSERPNRAARAAHVKGERQFRTYDTSYIRPKRSIAPTVVSIIVVLVAVVIALFFLFRIFQPPQLELLPEGQEATIIVEPGEGAVDIGQSLFEAKLVGSAKEFTDQVKSMNVAESLKPGTYTFAGGMGLEEIINQLEIGTGPTGLQLTIPEGYTIAQIAQAVQDATNGRITYDDFWNQAHNAEAYVEAYPFVMEAAENSLEGFLFPKTYSIEDSDTADTIIRKMLSQFQTETAGLDYSYPESLGFSRYDVLKLASIIEKEAGTDHAATVASVFYNRLTSDRPYLESDATTAYEVGHDPTPEEVHAQTPYSTYTNPGLPPTPICNPSLECLQAACTPDQTNYRFFYFVPNDQGGLDYYFSETYEEHQQAIENN